EVFGDRGVAEPAAVHDRAEHAHLIARRWQRGRGREREAGNDRVVRRVRGTAGAGLAEDREQHVRPFGARGEGADGREELVAERRIGQRVEAGDGAQDRGFVVVRRDLRGGVHDLDHRLLVPLTGADEREQHALALGARGDGIRRGAERVPQRVARAVALADLEQHLTLRRIGRYGRRCRRDIGESGVVRVATSGAHCHDRQDATDRYGRQDRDLRLGYGLVAYR